MNEPATRFGDLQPGDALGPLHVTVSEDANRRYFEAAGVAHALLDAGALYPPIAANLTILLFQQTCPDAVLHTRHRLQCHRIAPAGTPLVVTGSVRERSERRDRLYVEIESVVADGSGDPIWSSIATFTPVAAP